MNTDNRTNEPSEEQIERALDAISRFNQWTDNPRGAMRAALTAAGVAPQPVIDEAALAEVIADAPHSGDPNVSCLDPRCKAAAVAAWLREGVAPQEPSQTETKSGNNFVSLDPEKVAALIESERDRAAAERDFAQESLGQFMAPALCEAAKRGELSA